MGAYWGNKAPSTYWGSNEPQTLPWTFTLTSSHQDLNGRSWSNDPGFYLEPAKAETEFEKKLRIAFERSMAAIASVRLESAPEPLAERQWFRERRVGKTVESRYRVMLC